MSVGLFGKCLHMVRDWAKGGLVAGLSLACWVPAGQVMAQDGPQGNGRADAKPSTHVSIMSFNVWHADDREPLQAGIGLAVQAAGIDAVGFQEMHPDVGQKLAQEWAMGYDRESAIASPHKMLPEKLPHGVRLQTAGGKRFWVFNVHLIHHPYGPYQLLGIPYMNDPFHLEGEAGRFENVAADQVKARGQAMQRVLDEIKQASQTGEPVFLTGDFNEPSHVDWTPAAAEAGLHSGAVEWPTSKRVLAAGMVDAFRQVHPDEVAVPAATWSCVLGPDTNQNGIPEPQDRIDFVYSLEDRAQAVSALTVGPLDGVSNLGVVGYPSDHRSVVVRFVW